MASRPFNDRLNYLVGLNPFAPNCQPQGMTTDEITKTFYVDDKGLFSNGSGMFITDQDTLNVNMDDARNDCSPDSIWDVLYNARKLAVEHLEVDLLTSMNRYNTVSLNPFKGAIGRADSTGIIAVPQGTRVSIPLNPYYLPGAFIRITKVGLLVNANVDVQVSMPGQDSPVTVVCAANTASYTTLPEPVTYQLSEGDPLAFSYTIDGFQPRNNTLSCDCGGMMERLKKYIPVGQQAYGLLLMAEVMCDPLLAVYNGYEMQPEIATVLAHTLRYGTLVFAIDRIINSGRIERWTMLEADHLYKKRGYYRQQYDLRIAWLTDVENKTGFDMATIACYACRPVAPGLRKRGILS